MPHHCYYHDCYIVGVEGNENTCGQSGSKGVGRGACLLVEGPCGAMGSAGLGLRRKGRFLHG